MKIRKPYGSYPSHYCNLTPEKIAERRAVQKAYYKNHRTKLCANAKAYWDQHPEERKVLNAKHAPLAKIRRKDAMLERAGRPQPSNCEICGREEKAGRSGHKQTVFDHDHVTNAFRGWLCHKCNVSLGMAEDDSKILHAMAAYIERGGYGPGPAELALPTPANVSGVLAYIESCIGVPATPDK